MRLGFASDHGGHTLKRLLIQTFRERGMTVHDFGSEIFDPQDDYPDFVIPLAKAVVRGDVERGVAICGSGVGACVAANKVRGVRAALITDCYSARQGVEDDDMNIICLGGRVTGQALAAELLEAFLKARFIGADRYRRRLEKIAALEAVTVNPTD